MSSEKPPLSLEEAEALARRHLEAKGFGDVLSQRSVSSKRVMRGFKVIFSPPAGMRAGDFTLIISKAGEVLSQRFER